MKYEPVTEREKELKALISKAIKKKVKNFYRPRGDMSITDDGEGICFAPGKQPAVSKSYNWQKKAAKEFVLSEIVGSVTNMNMHFSLLYL